MGPRRSLDEPKSTFNKNDIDFDQYAPTINEQIDAKIDAEKVMKIDEKSMRKWYRNWLNIYLKIGRLRKVPNAK